MRFSADSNNEKTKNAINVLNVRMRVVNPARVTIVCDMRVRSVKNKHAG